MKLPLILATLAFFFFSSVARADGVTMTVSPSGADWLQINPNLGVLPAVLTTPVFAGSENEPEFEPIGEFDFNVAFAVPKLVSYAVLDPDGSVSDFIGVGNQNGHGVVFFASDPLATTGPITPVGVLCTESDSSGCVAPLTIKTANGGSITLNIASDGEKRPFDPFGVGFDTTDGLQLTSASTPEPSTFALLACGLVGLAGILQKRLGARAKSPRLFQTVACSL